jgi:hypothetical protein
MPDLSNEAAKIPPSEEIEPGWGIDCICWKLYPEVQSQKYKEPKALKRLEIFTVVSTTDHDIILVDGQSIYHRIVA